VKILTLRRNTPPRIRVVEANQLEGTLGSIASREFFTKIGTPFIVRTAQTEDAAELFAHFRTVASDSRLLVTEADEFASREDVQRQWIQSHLVAPGQLAIVAEAAKGIIGFLSFENGVRNRTAHDGSCGMSVHKDWRGRGVGTALLQCLLDWAEASLLIERVSLGVFAENLSAINLYKKFGFVEEGNRSRQVKLGPCDYQDVILMRRFVFRQGGAVDEAVPGCGTGDSPSDVP
jgi:RimJ/RimL family protein N-acetyltransferase